MPIGMHIQRLEWTEIGSTVTSRRTQCLRNYGCGFPVSPSKLEHMTGIPLITVSSHAWCKTMLFWAITESSNITTQPFCLTLQIMAKMIRQTHTFCQAAVSWWFGLHCVLFHCEANLRERQGHRLGRCFCGCLDASRTDGSVMTIRVTGWTISPRAGGFECILDHFSGFETASEVDVCLDIHFWQMEVQISRESTKQSEKLQGECV